jgi:outer membrane protein OmpA-like peptidoglycan-associated protein
MRKSSLRSLSMAATTLAISMVAVGCGTPTVFQGTTGIAIMGTPPAAPKPPPPPPPEEPKRVKIVDNKIEITEKVFFEFDKALIKSESNGLLDEVAKVMVDNKHVEKVRVDGHASLEKDTTATRQYNKQLSSLRALAVMKYLVSKGVEQSRLESKGFGNEQPVGTNDTDEGREKNRRVEFTILKQSVTKKKVEVKD